MKFDLFLNEKRIGQVHDVIPIDVTVDTTAHAEERKLRHGTDNKITDEEIISAVQRALRTIATNQLKDIDEIGQKYWIYYPSYDNLNVVGTLIRNKYNNPNDILTFLVITIMHEKDFRGSPDARKITL